MEGCKCKLFLYYSIVADELARCHTLSVETTLNTVSAGLPGALELYLVASGVVVVCICCPAFAGVGDVLPP